MKYSVITFGAAAYDTFIQSSEFKIKKSPEGALLCELYGKKITIDQQTITTGGGATNAAVCFERFGIQSGIIACVGNDYWGQLVKLKLKEDGVSLVHLQTNQALATSSSIILVGKDGERTVLVHRAASNAISWYKTAWDKLNANWAYVTSLGGNFTLLTKIVRLCREKKIKLAFNPGNKELKQKKTLQRFLSAVDVLFMNHSEALMFFKKKNQDFLDKKDLFKLNCGMVIITNGKGGSTLYNCDGTEITQSIYPAKRVEVTGAGDAFGSSFVAGQINGLDLQASLKLASINAASVVSQIGAKDGLLFWPEAKKKVDKWSQF